MKETAPAPVKPSADVKTDKAFPSKTGTDVKSEAVPAKPAPDVKTGSATGKSEMGAKDEKGSAVKPGASLKGDKSLKSDEHAKASVSHGKKSHGKMACAKMHHKKAAATHKDTDKKMDKSNSVAPSTGK